MEKELNIIAETLKKLLRPTIPTRVLIEALNSEHGFNEPKHYGVSVWQQLNADSDMTKARVISLVARDRLGQYPRNIRWEGGQCKGYSIHGRKPGRPSTMRLCPTCGNRTLKKSLAKV